VFCLLKDGIVDEGKNVTLNESEGSKEIRFLARSAVAHHYKKQGGKYAQKNPHSRRPMGTQESFETFS